MKEKQKIIDKNITKTNINWEGILFVVILSCAILLPILMVLFNFGPTETAETKEEMEQQLLHGDPWLPY